MVRWTAGPARTLLGVATATLAAAATLAVGAGLTWAALRELTAQDRRAAVWLLVGGLGALLPVAMADPSPRLLLVPSVASAVAMSMWIAWAWRRRHAARAWAGRLAWLVLAGVVALRAVFGPGVLIKNQLYVRELGRSEQHVLEQLAAANACDRPEVTDVLLLNRMPRISPNLDLDLRLRGLSHTRWWHVSRMAAPQVLRRTGPRSFELARAAAVPDPVIEPQFPPGARISLPVAELTLIDSRRRIGVTLAAAPEDPHVCIARIGERGIERVVLPEIGGELEIATAATYPIPPSDYSWAIWW
jgi:hypothetical protein